MQERKNCSSVCVSLCITVISTEQFDYLSLNGLICLHSVLDKAGSQSIFKRT